MEIHICLSVEVFAIFLAQILNSFAQLIYFEFTTAYSSSSHNVTRIHVRRLVFLNFMYNNKYKRGEFKAKSIAT
jgi:hypothetical protein